MRPRLWFNLLLFLGVALLAFLVFRDSGHDEIEAIADIDSQTVGRIEIQRRQRETLRFEKRGHHWDMVAPLNAPADATRIKQLLAIARLPSRASYPLDHSKLSQYGLDSPQASLLLGNLRLDIGTNQPLEARRYLRSGETLYVVDDIFLHYLIGPANDYTEKDPPATASTGAR